MQDGFTVELRYTETMLRTAVRAFVWRRLVRRGWLWLATCALLLASLSLGWWTGPGFAAGVALAGLVSLFAFVAAVWYAHFTNTVGRFRAMDPPTARFSFGDADMTVASNLGTVTLPWSSVMARWNIEGAWVLFLAPSQFVTLPTAGLSREAQAFLHTKLPEASHV